MKRAKFVSRQLLPLLGALVGSVCLFAATFALSILFEN